MKKVLLAIAAVATITSCSQNEEFENPAQKAEIGFNTAVTRATELTTNGLQTAGFKIYAYNTGTSDMASAIVLPASAWIDDVAKYSEAWSMENGTYYWPLTDKLQFFAYSPKDAVTYNDPNGTDAGYPKFTYQVATNAGGQKDLVIASAQNMTKKSSGVTSPVSLTFKHALTQINIQVVQESTDYTYTIEKVKVIDVKGKGTFEYTGVNTGSWTTDEAETNTEYEYTLGTFADGTSAVVSDNALMLIPQDITNAKISIKYSTEKGGSSIFNDTKEIALPTTPAWDFGKKITYKLTLSVGEGIKVEGTVDESWSSTDPSDTPVAG